MSGTNSSHDTRAESQKRTMTQKPPEPQIAADPLLEVRWQNECPGNPSAWDAAVRNSCDTWLYHLSSMASLFQPPNAQPPVFVECWRDGQLVGGATLVVTSYRWHKLLSRHYAKSFIGPMSVSPFVITGLSDKLEAVVWRQVIDGCIAAANALRCDEILLCDTVQSLRCVEMRPVVNRYISDREWHFEMSYNYILDLRPDVEVLFKNLETRCRTSIRRAREQLQVVGGDELENGRQVHVELMESVYQREGMQLVGRDNLFKIWDQVYAAGLGKVFFCVMNGKPCSFTGVTRFGKVASYQHAARTEDSPSGAAALGLWSAIEWAKSAGVVWFDCNGAIFETSGRERQRAISMFKRSFGGDVVQIHGARRYFRPVARATFDFVDQWGVVVKRSLRKLNPFRK